MNGCRNTDKAYYMHRLIQGTAEIRVQNYKANFRKEILIFVPLMSEKNVLLRNHVKSRNKVHDI